MKKHTIFRLNKAHSPTNTLYEGEDREAALALVNDPKEPYVLTTFIFRDDGISIEREGLKLSYEPANLEEALEFENKEGVGHVVSCESPYVGSISLYKQEVGVLVKGLLMPLMK